jgi:hypothetical protein
VYDMYPWNDRPGPGTSDRQAARPDDRQDDRGGAGLPAPRDGRNPLAADAPGGPEAGPAAEAMQAVQVALDRRDNGGDAVGAVSPSTPGRTRQ